MNVGPAGLPEVVIHGGRQGSLGRQAKGITMKNEEAVKCWCTIEIPAHDFQHRVNEMAADPAKTTSVYSRLALIHLVAKEYAREEVERVGLPDSQIEIEELTDPPLSDVTDGDEPVVIRFSYKN